MGNAMIRRSWVEDTHRNTAFAVSQYILNYLEIKAKIES